MKTKFFITVNNRGIVKVTKNPTYTNINEVSIGCSLELPDTLFKRPQIEAKIVVNHEDVQPFEINADTANNVKDAIQQSTGLEVKLSIVNPE